MASFFRQFKAIGPLFCSFVQHLQLELRTSKAYSKRQNLVHNKNIDVQNLENIGSPLGVFHSDFFSLLCDFFEAFWIPPIYIFRILPRWTKFKRLLKKIYLRYKQLRLSRKADFTQQRLLLIVSIIRMLLPAETNLHAKMCKKIR